MYQDFWYTLAHAHTVYTRPSPPPRGPGDEASYIATVRFSFLGPVGGVKGQPTALFFFFFFKVPTH